MSASDLRSQIGEHRRTIAALAARTDAILANVEALTVEAREGLDEYQACKRRAGDILSQVSQRYESARRHLAEVDALFSDLLALRDAHILLTRGVNSAVAAEDAIAPQAAELLVEARRQLRDVCSRIERARADAMDDGPDVTSPD